MRTMWKVSLVATALVVGIPALSAMASVMNSGLPDAADANLQLWLDAADAGTINRDAGSGTAVTQWADKSTNGDDFWQGTTGTQPTYGTYWDGSASAVRFDGNDFVGTGGTLPGGARTMFIVYKALSLPSGTGSVIFGDFKSSGTASGFQYSIWDISGAGLLFQTADNAGNWGAINYFNNTANEGQQVVGTGRLGAIVVDPTDATAGTEVCYEGTQGLNAWSGSGDTPGVTLSTGANTLVLGTDPTDMGGGLMFNGDIAEILVYDRVLTSEEQNEVGNYLQEKWDIDGAYVPEPATLALLSVGGSLALLRRQRRA